MNYIIHNGELYHYGVKGMKWGVVNDKKPMPTNDKKAWKQQPETKMRKVSKALRGVAIGGASTGVAAKLLSTLAGQAGDHAGSKFLNAVGDAGLRTAIDTGAVSVGLAIGDKAVRKKHARQADSQNADAPKSEPITNDTPVSQAAQSNKSKKGKKIAAGIIAGVVGTAAVAGAVAYIYNDGKYKEAVGKTDAEFREKLKDHVRSHELIRSKINKIK